jgi:NAD(P)-dependent dehydrogenase (short-subunit alcohol dehydrogenase family)
MEKTMYGLQGKRAIVTGAGNGIGRSIATRLAKEGCSIGIFDIDAKAAGETMRHIRAQGSHCHSVLGDVSSKSSVSAGMAELVTELGELGVPHVEGHLCCGVEAAALLASIVTVEARHQSAMAILAGQPASNATA